MLQIKTLAHAGLVVKDLESCRWFYGEVLQMQEIARPRNFRFDGAWFRFGDSELHMITERDTVAPAGFRDPGSAAATGLATHLAFEVADLDAVHAHLTRHAIPIAGGPMPRGDGVMQLYVHDPNGYLLEFFQWVVGSEIDAPTRDAVAAPGASSGRQS